MPTSSGSYLPLSVRFPLLGVVVFSLCPQLRSWLVRRDSSRWFVRICRRSPFLSAPSTSTSLPTQIGWSHGTQDLSLAVRARAQVSGFGPWSTKDGIPHVQPPVELLEQMLTVRLHLDDANDSNGALRVLPGSHRLGRLSAERIQQLRREQCDILCSASAGDGLLMRPLLLHASSRSTSLLHRRVLHVEYAAFTLPDELQWHEAA